MRTGASSRQSDAGIVEILRPDGTSCDADEAGEVVTTCLLHDYQIFIRYHLGDMAMWDPESCPCKRQMPVIKEVIGRTEDVILGLGRRQMVRFHGIFTDQPHIREGQVIQETLKQFCVKVVPTEGYCVTDEKAIIKRMRERLGFEAEIVVEAVSNIPRTKAGKFQAVISRVSKDGTQK